LRDDGAPPERERVLAPPGAAHSALTHRRALTAHSVPLCLPDAAALSMSTGKLRFLTLVKPVLHVLPEVAPPDRKIPFKVCDAAATASAVT